MIGYSMVFFLITFGGFNLSILVSSGKRGKRLRNYGKSPFLMGKSTN